MTAYTIYLQILFKRFLALEVITFFGLLVSSLYEHIFWSKLNSDLKILSY